MLKLTTLPVLDSFLQRLEQQPSRFRQVILISPFIEFSPGVAQERWRRILGQLQAAGTETVLITRPRGTAAHGQNVLLFNQCMYSRPAMFLSELHAKLYLAIGKDRGSSLCLLGSANLSEAAINGNLEISLSLEPPYTSAEIAYVDKMHQLGDQILRKARKQTYR